MDTATRTPLHLWIVGALATLWNGFGAYDYLMSRMHDEAYVRAMMPGVDPATVFAYMDAMPLYASAGWGLGVWGGLIGSLLLLARSRHAVWVFALSLIGMAMSFSYQLFLGPTEPVDMHNPLVPLLITAIGVGLWLYARAMTGKGVLR